MEACTHSFGQIFTVRSMCALPRARCDRSFNSNLEAVDWEGRSSFLKGLYLLVNHWASGHILDVNLMPVLLFAWPSLTQNDRWLHLTFFHAGLFRYGCYSHLLETSPVVLYRGGHSTLNRNVSPFRDIFVQWLIFLCVLFERLSLKFVAAVSLVFIVTAIRLLEAAAKRKDLSALTAFLKLPRRVRLRCSHLQLLFWITFPLELFTSITEAFRHETFFIRFCTRVNN